VFIEVNSEKAPQALSMITQFSKWGFYDIIACVQQQQAQTQDGGKCEEAKAPPVSNNKWEGTTFAQDQDGKMTAKFKRLMGIKDAGGTSFSLSVYLDR
jgi:cyclophilin family peptidyl-prolyl cis-trans isomerase